MPTQWAHTFYWEHTDTVVAPVAVSHGGYPVWQAGVIAPSLFGIFAAWFETRWAQLQWWWRLYQRIKGLRTEQRAVVLRAMDFVEHPSYPLAQQAVRTTAQTLGFNQPQAWVKLSHTLKDHRGWAENSWRHLNACHLLNEASRAQGSTLTNPDLNGLVELAYQGFAYMGR